MLTSYKDLLVWQKSVDFTVHIYKITRSFPKEELFSLTSQVRRSSSAIPSNIAEGFCRKHTREYLQFLKIAFSSGAETETHLIIAHRVEYLNTTEYSNLSIELEEIMKMLNGLISKLALKLK